MLDGIACLRTANTLRLIGRIEMRVRDLYHAMAIMTS
jgi:hypothetical protein